MKIVFVVLVVLALGSSQSWAFPYPMSRSAFTCKYYVEVNDKTPKWVLENPLLRFSDLPFGAIPFELIQESHLEPALRVTHEACKERVGKLIHNDEEPTFQNTIVAIEESFEPASMALHVLHHMVSSRSSPHIQKISKVWRSRFRKVSDSLSLNPTLFSRIEKLVLSKERLGLTPVQERLLLRTYNSMKAAGARLGPEVRKEIAKLELRISRLQLEFGNNYKESMFQTGLYMSDREALTGVPEELVNRAQELALKEGKSKGFTISLDTNTYIYFMTYLENRSVRKRLHNLFSQIATTGKTNNLKVALKIANLRQKVSLLRGFKSFADFQLKDRVEADPKVVRKFLEDLGQKYLAAAKKEMAELEAFAGHKIEPHDFYFYSQKLKKSLFQFDPKEVREYFQLENVVAGAMTVAKRLYNITGTLRPDLGNPKPRLDAFEFTDDHSGEHLALYYLDPLGRANKSQNPHNRNLQPTGIFFGDHRRPHVLNSLNESPPNPDTGVTLLSHNGVRTNFHEFGHGLQGMLTVGDYTSLLGTNVPRDVLELPSQFFERWAFQPEVLALYAKHHITGEPMPKHLVDGLYASERFQAGTNGLIQIRYALLDFAWHDGTVQLPKSVTDILAWESEVLAPWTVDNVYTRTISQRFTHAFESGYAAGYYVYKRAEVNAASAFRPFREYGLFNQEWAKKFRETILERGNQEDARELFRRFLGHDPDINDLLREEGLYEP